MAENHRHLHDPDEPDEVAAAVAVPAAVVAAAEQVARAVEPAVVPALGRREVLIIIIIRIIVHIPCLTRFSKQPLRSASFQSYHPHLPSVQPNRRRPSPFLPVRAKVPSASPALAVAPRRHIDTVAVKVTVAAVSAALVPVVLVCLTRWPSVAVLPLLAHWPRLLIPPFDRPLVINKNAVPLHRSVANRIRKWSLDRACTIR